MTGLIPLIAALALIEAGLRARVVPVSSSRLVAAMIIGALLLPLLCETGSRVVARWRHHPRLVDHWEVVMQGMVLAWFGWLCLGLGWAAVQGAYSVALAPWVAGQAICWWCLPAPAAPAVRRAQVWHQLRYGLAPLLLALPILDLCAWIGESSGWATFLARHLGQWANVTGSFLLAVGVLTALPWLLMYLWRARPLPDSPLAAQLHAACTRAGVNVAGLRLWPVAGRGMYNAMVLGLVPRLRYVLFTPDLLRDFTPLQVEAVLGHELGHVRHRHLWLYLLFAITAGLGSWTLADPLRHALYLLPGTAHLPPALVQGGLAVGLALGAWRLGFGVLSRTCERQADLAGAELVGSTGVMQSALHTLAGPGGLAADAPNWRHDTIRMRMAWLDLVDADPAVARRQHQLVLAAWLILAGTAAGFAFAALHRGLLA